MANSPGKIQEAFVKCTNCGKTVPGTQAVRAKSHFLALVDGFVKDLGPATLCEDCLEGRNGPLI